MKQRVSRTLSFWRKQGTAAMLMLVMRKLRAVASGKPLFNPLEAKVPPGAMQPWEPAAPKSAERSASALQIADARFPNLRPLRTCLMPLPARPRISLVTDSISAGSLFGGVGTALILAANMANRMNATLRIITRNEKAPPENVMQVLSVYGITLEHEVQFLFASIEDRLQEVDLFPGELFLTTSWWTTAATLPAVPHRDIVYLLQEDERMFYPFGDERLLCESILSNPDIRYLINTELLYRHFLDSGLQGIRNRGTWFEPAFPSSVFHPRKREAAKKKRFFFYARPDNHRNLFQLGVAAVDRAINQGLFSEIEWDFYFVGKNIPPVVFGDEWAPFRRENLNWAEYAELAGTIDLALSLMSTPHPSYPPLDMAASGAVVVTNRFGLKQDLAVYSENIICADPAVDALVAAMRQAVRLVDSPQRWENFKRNGLGQSWETSLRHIVNNFAEG